jgi:hypothetical protein
MRVPDGHRVPGTRPPATAAALDRGRAAGDIGDTSLPGWWLHRCAAPMATGGERYGPVRRQMRRGRKNKRGTASEIAHGSA